MFQMIVFDGPVSVAKRSRNGFVTYPTLSLAQDIAYTILYSYLQVSCFTRQIVSNTVGQLTQEQRIIMVDG